MKPIKLLMIVTAAALITFGLGGYALAFHDGGVAACDGCHTMHNSENGVPINPNGSVGYTAGDHLTIGTDNGSTCLNCHSDEGAGRSGSYHVMSPDGSYYHPGGDFYWLTKTFTWTAHNTPQSSDGANHGHNVIAVDYGLVQDPVSAAPGGIYQSQYLTCTSCHDPHGTKANKNGPITDSGSYGAQPTATTDVGNFRLLGDVGYKPTPGNVTFTNAPPIAVTKSGAAETDAFYAPTGVAHTDYGSGMSEWCSNCHTAFLAPGGSGQHKHPAGNTATLGTLANNYNLYVKTGLFNGDQSISYLALVPFERHPTDPTTLDPTSTAGPANGSSPTVMCLSCHRAHASAFTSAGRWDFETEFPAVDSHPMDTDGGAQAGDQLNSYYGRPMVSLFGDAQRSFCNKCHAKD